MCVLRYCLSILFTLTSQNVRYSPQNLFYTLAQKRKKINRPVMALLSSHAIWPGFFRLGCFFREFFAGTRLGTYPLLGVSKRGYWRRFREGCFSVSGLSIIAPVQPPRGVFLRFQPSSLLLGSWEGDGSPLPVLSCRCVLCSHPPLSPPTLRTTHAALVFWFLSVGEPFS